MGIKTRFNPMGGTITSGTKYQLRWIHNQQPLGRVINEFELQSIAAIGNLTRAYFTYYPKNETSCHVCYCNDRSFNTIYSVVQGTRGAFQVEPFWDSNCLYATFGSSGIFLGTLNSYSNRTFYNTILNSHHSAGWRYICNYYLNYSDKIFAITKSNELYMFYNREVDLYNRVYVNRFILNNVKSVCTYSRNEMVAFCPGNQAYLINHYSNSNSNIKLWGNYIDGIYYPPINRFIFLDTDNDVGYGWNQLAGSVTNIGLCYCGWAGISYYCNQRGKYFFFNNANLYRPIGNISFNTNSVYIGYHYALANGCIYNLQNFKIISNCENVINIYGGLTYLTEA